MGTDLRRLGVLTVGQAPRDDITPTLRAVFGEPVHLQQCGALDGLTDAGVADLAPIDGETPLETRLLSGDPVLVAEERLKPLLRAVADRLTSSCDVTFVLCSGEFPALAESHPAVVQPVHILRGAVTAFCRNRVLGIIGPPSDMTEALARWGAFAGAVITSAASPYGHDGEVAAAAADLAERGAQIMFLNDMAFTAEHRAAAAIAGVPVLCALTVVARVLRDVV